MLPPFSLLCPPELCLCRVCPARRPRGVPRTRPQAQVRRDRGRHHVQVRLPFSPSPPPFLARLTMSFLSVSLVLRDAYVTMKMIEKGIDPSTKARGGGAGGPAGGKFNAFRDMNKDSSSAGQKRRRGAADEGDDKSAGGGKKAKLEVEIEYLGQKLKVDESTGQLQKPEELVPPQGHVLRFEGWGPRVEGDWRVLKVRPPPPPNLLLYDLTFASNESSPAEPQHLFTPVTLFACVVTPSTQEELIKLGFANPFMALPKDAAHGSFENPTFPFTAESVAELNSKKVQMNGQPLTFSIVEGDAVRTHYLARANFAAKRALEEAKSKGTSNARSGGGRGGRGGRGGGRGGRGGQNGGGGGRGGRKDGGNGKMDVDAKKEEVKEEVKPRVSPQPYPPFPLLSHS